MVNDTTGVFDTLVEHSTLETPEQAANALVDLINAATRETYGGEFADMVVNGRYSGHVMFYIGSVDSVVGGDYIHPCALFVLKTTARYLQFINRRNMCACTLVFMIA